MTAVPLKLAHVREYAMLRLALVADLFVYVLGLALFAYYRMFHHVGEQYENKALGIALTLASIPVVIGLAGRLFEKPRLPHNQWAYMACFLYGLLSMMAFNFITPRVAPLNNTEFGLIANVWMLSGVVGAFFGHVMDGGNGPSIASRIEKMRDGRVS
jgi:hypothetical protein